MRWRKSSYSGDANGNCVEVAPTSPGMCVRDTKDPDAGNQRHSPTAWTAFTRALRKS